MTSPATRKLGRPRAMEWKSTLEPREDVLRAAGWLFTTQGYTSTSTREIAAAAGLRQGSLFHYFKRKRDILAELLDRTVDFPMGLHARLAEMNLEPEVKLYLLSRGDVSNILAGAHNLGALTLLPEVRTGEFASFWEKRSQVRDAYRVLIEAGIASNVLDDLELDLATDLVFGLIESTITWFDRSSMRGREEVAEATASAALRVVLRDSGDLDRIRQAANLPGDWVVRSGASKDGESPSPAASRLLPIRSARQGHRA